MGYTHRFRRNRDLTEEEFSQIKAGFKQLLTFNKQIIKPEFDCGWISYTKHPNNEGQGICFNGIAEGAHETFAIYQLGKDDSGMSFCKTNRKPYDVFVVAMLGLLELTAPSAFEIGSDGDPEDWLAGLSLLAKATGKYAVCDIDRNTCDVTVRAANANERANRALWQTEMEVRIPIPMPAPDAKVASWVFH